MGIARAAPDDFRRIEALLSDLGLPNAGLAEQFPTAYVVAVDEGHLLGCAGLEVYDRTGLLRSVAVSPDARGRGLGRALVEDRLAAAWSAGIDAVYLLTTTAAAYFHRFGFRAEDRGCVPPALASSAEFAGACPTSAACLARRR